jgi:hypothetical protein
MINKNSKVKEDFTKLLEERSLLIKEMILRANKALYENYLTLKKIISINEKVYGDANFEQIAEELSCDTQQIRYLLRFDKLVNKEWINKIPVNTLLMVLNWNDDAEDRQEEHFEVIKKGKYNAEKTRVYLLKEYIKKENLNQELPHFLFRKITSQINFIRSFLYQIRKSTIKKQEKEQLKRQIQELSDEAEKLLEEEDEITVSE